MKTKSHQDWGRIAVVVFLALLTTSPDAEARVGGKVVKPPRGAPPPQTRTLTMPPTYAGKAATSSHVPRGLAASKAVASSAPWTVVREPANQTPIFVKFNQPQAAAKRSTAIAPKAHVLQFITENAEMFRLRDPASELVHRTTHEDRRGGNHVKLEQRYLGVPVWGAAIVGHWSAEKGLYAINGRYQPSPDYITEVEPSITRESAIDLALGDLKQHRSIQTLSPRMQELLDYRGPEAELYLWSARQEEPVRLTWVVEIQPNLPERWRYFIDAHTGQVLQHYQASPSCRPAVGEGVDLQGYTVDLLTTECDDGLFYLEDRSEVPFLRTWDARNTDLVEISDVTSTDGTFNDPVAVSAHDNMRRVYEYFLENHGRRGIFPDGRPITAVIHVTEDGEGMDNAYWNPAGFMCLGDGHETYIRPTAESLDLVAHEMMHGIIQQTAGLIYTYESGALNESIADIFGAMVDDDDWLMDEDIVNKAYFPSGALRDLQNPHNGDVTDGIGWQPAHMGEYRDLPLYENNGGIHTNSGIHNRAAYLVAEAIGRPKTAQIYYHTLSYYLTSRSEFRHCRLAAVEAAWQLYGEDEALAVSDAYDDVGIRDPRYKMLSPDGPPTDPGTHWVAIVAAELDGDTSPWLVKPTSDPLEGREGWEYITQLTTTQVYPVTGRPIAAPVNGDFLLFVDSDNNLRIINADGSDEEVINDLGDWHSIALSPDGSRVVATTTYDEPVIWYLDIESENSQWTEIELYEPTTQAGIRQNIARYADVLQWDATGTVVIYDVLNSLPAPRGETIDYWTVNALEPTTETIWPLFPAQPEGVHISSPSLSSALLPDGTIDDCRLLYERIDEPNVRTEIRVMDFCTGDEGVLYTIPEPTFTFPGFINGDREIVFQWWGIEDDVEVVDLFRQPLTEDGLSSQGELLSFMLDAQFPYTMVLASDVSAGIVGSTAVEEQAGTPQPTEFSLAQNYPNPFNAGTLISYSLPSAGPVILDIFNIHGQRVATLDQGVQTTGMHTISWAGLDAEGQPVASGVYFYRLRLPGEAQEGQRQTRKMLLLR